IIVVFGAGGDRDKDKRHKMGAIAKEFADKVIITTDNPRNEEPLRIMEDIASGIDNKENVYLIENRVEAIRKSISLAKSGDTIIIAGKGAEEYFEKNGKKYPYSDKNTLEELLGIKWK
ncbi:MAG: UDP-N-acetylmuramoyl-L-alanyl-D-glutamate--2,6-diaminopimelate ligase, partial [Clostridia bacterium]|nr:UDP-N-acetylmuramoyl-L-alanyl-D-glutamate--2,6-diaminopimelate ligase [Clostridia bacterium]